LRGVNVVRADEPLSFDRRSRKLTGAGMLDRIALRTLQTGSVITRPYDHRGYRVGCNVVAAAVGGRDIVVRLNGDAVFAIPFADGYWSRILNASYDYEEEIDTFLRRAADVRYAFVDCGANFGYWSVLASSRPFGSQPTIAVEASPENAKRLEFNALLNGNRFRCLNAAIGRKAGGFARICGARHENFGTVALANDEPDAVSVVSLDSLAADGLIAKTIPVVVKLDVEGVEIEALTGATELLRGDCVVICEEHGADPTHAVTRHLLNEMSLTVFVFDGTQNRFIRLDDIKILDRIKRHPWVGYNVFATSSAMWKERLLAPTTRTDS
jgi:FkbM family methyltransferase